jgi:hypothetical protein
VNLPFALALSRLVARADASVPPESWYRMQECAPDWIDKAPFLYQHTIRLPFDPERAFDLVVDPRFEAEWFPNFRSARWHGTPGVGAVREYQLSYLRLIERFTIWRRGERFSFWVSSSSLPLTRRFQEDYVFRADGTGAIVNWRVGYEPDEFLRPLHPILRPFFAQDFRTAADQLTKLGARLAKR